MHDLRINRESTRGHKGYEVHDVHFTDSRNAVFWTTARTARNLRSSSARWPTRRPDGRPGACTVSDARPIWSRYPPTAAIGILTGKDKRAVLGQTDEWLVDRRAAA